MTKCETLGIAVPTNIKSEADAQKRLDLYRAEWRKQAQEQARAKADKMMPANATAAAN